MHHMKRYGIFDDISFIEPIYESKNNKAPRVTAKVIDTSNPNDGLSSKAVDLTFYNENKEKVGEASISAVDTDNGFLYNVEVLKKYRGMGYGSSIMEYVLKHYKVKELTVEETNEIAINLYKKYGFKVAMKFKENGKNMLDMKR